MIDFRRFANRRLFLILVADFRGGTSRTLMAIRICGLSTKPQNHDCEMDPICWLNFENQALEYVYEIRTEHQLFNAANVARRALIAVPTAIPVPSFMFHVRHAILHHS
jgi:hypothetical protein